MKNKKEATAIRDTIHAEYDNLPEFDQFGDSNVEQKAELFEWITELTEYIEKGIISENTEVSAWINDESSFVADYE